MKGLSGWVSGKYTAESVAAESEMMRNRLYTMTRENAEALGNIRMKSKGAVLGGAEAMRELAERAGMGLIVKAQLFADMPTYIGGKLKALDEFKDQRLTPEELSKRAIAAGEQAVKDAQGGGQIHDLARIQRGGEISRLFLTMFYSFCSARLNTMINSSRMIDPEHPVASRFRVLNDFLMMYYAPMAVMWLINRVVRGGDDDPEEWLGKIAKDVWMEPMADIPFLREGMGALRGFDVAPAGMAPVASMGRLAVQVGQGDIDKALSLSALDFVGIMLGLPTDQISAIVRGGAALVDNDDANVGALLMGPPRRR